MAGLTALKSELTSTEDEGMWLTLVPTPLPEPSPELVDRMLKMPARPWTPPAGIAGIY